MRDECDSPDVREMRREQRKQFGFRRTMVVNDGERRIVGILYKIMIIIHVTVNENYVGGRRRVVESPALYCDRVKCENIRLGSSTKTCRF